MKTNPLLFVIVIVALTANAFAQTGPALLLQSWPDANTHAQVRSDSFFFADGDTDGPAGADDFDLAIYDVSARVNPDPAADVVRFGFDMTYMDIDSNDPAIPSRLVDQSIAASFGIARQNNWEIGAVVGVGFAGDNPYADGEAVYALADLIASYKIDDSSSVQFILSYNGNRGIFPDTPLPAIAYYHRLSDQFSYTFGLPYSSIHWVPLDRLTVDFSYAVPFTVNGTIDYEFVDHWHVFAAFINRFEAFHLDGDDDNRRLFFTQRRLEIGLRWELATLFEQMDAELILAGGYAFDQEFERGFDARDLRNVRDVSDEPYVRVGLQFGF